MSHLRCRNTTKPPSPAVRPQRKQTATLGIQCPGEQASNEDHNGEDHANTEPPLALPKSSTFGDFNKRHEYEKRDSAKSLHESPPSRQGPPPIEHEDPESRDRYGFRKANQYVTREQYDTWNTGYVEYLARRRKKWVAYHKEMGLLTDKPDRFPPPASTKTKRFVRKGIPPDWRGAAWFYYAGGPAILAEYSGVYDELLTKQVSAVDAEAIERDLHRTFPDNIKFKPNNLSTNTDSSRSSNQTTSETASSGGEDGEPRMISSLRRVLRAFAIQNPLIGYCQSLNFLAGLLLLFLETEEQAFWLLNVITRVYLPGTHAMSLEGSKVDLGVLMGAIRESMPAVWAKIGDEMDGDPNESRPTTSGASAAKKARSRRKHMANKSVSTDRLPPITLCMTAWFMSCFIGTLPIETTLRVWDVFFLESSKTLFRVALTIFKLGEAEIKAIADPMEMFSVVQAMPRRLIDANALMESCYKRRNAFGHLNQETIDALRQERRDKTQLDRDKLAGHVTDGESKVRRKNTLFGRRPKRDASA
ncbi:GTPase-activating protein gyp3 like [Verticillium longisporum]|nr:GTPase-activating protein gyp3 like [Verticillium longisporum]